MLYFISEFQSVLVLILEQNAFALVSLTHKFSGFLFLFLLISIFIGHECCLDPNQKPLLCEKKPDDCCQLGCFVCAYNLHSPRTLCKQSQHCCCCVQECSFPPEKEMPCVCGTYGLICAPKCGCCVPFKDVKK
jgi:hypothetical protein